MEVIHSGGIRKCPLKRRKFRNQETGCSLNTAAEVTESEDRDSQREVASAPHVKVFNLRCLGRTGEFMR